MKPSSEKREAIYDLREAVEAKTKLELAVDHSPSPSVRAALLDATLDVESKTRHAIDVCHECGQQHVADAPSCNGSN